MSRWLLYGFLAVLLPGPVFGQSTKQAMTDKEIRKVIANCKTKLLKWPKISLPNNWLGKGEKYRGAPIVAYAIAADGSVHDVG